MEMNLDINQMILALTFLFMNVGAFIYLGRDKTKAIGHHRRIPEAYFLFLSIAFCALGILLGMMFFRHKIRKLYFLFGVPLALLENLSLLYVAYRFFALQIN